MNTKSAQHQRFRSGFSIIDAVLSLFVVAVIISLFGGLTNARESNRNTSFRAQAAAIADEQLNALREAGFVALNDQVNGAFQRVLYNAGAWGIVSDPADLSTAVPCIPPTNGLHCGQNTLEVSGAAGMGGAVSARMQFPAFSYSDGALQTSVKVLNDSPAGWATGLMFRAQDAGNGYRVRVAAAATDLDTAKSGTQNLVLEKLVNGAATTLYSPAGTVSMTPNAWQKLRVELAGTSISVYLNGVLQGGAAVTDTANPWTSGAAALLGWGGAHVRFDDVLTTVNGMTSTWDFEGSTAVPAAWTRFGLNDLPDGTSALDDNGILTIEPYPDPSSSDLKRVTVTVRWNQNGARTFVTTALIGRSGLGS